MISDLLAMKDGKVTKDMLLGVLAMPSVPDRPVPGNKLRREWLAANLDPDAIPDTRQPVHNFQNACTHVEKRHRKVIGGEKVTQVSAEQVLHNADKCVYQFTRLERRPDAEVIDYEAAMTLVYKKATGDIECIPLDATSYRAMRYLEDEVRAYFDANSTTVPGSKIRTAVRHMLAAEKATMLRDAAYFVPITGYETVEALQQVLERLYADDSKIIVLPWLDTRHTRTVVQEAAAEEVRTSVEKMVADIANRLKTNGEGPKVRKDFVANRMNERIAMGHKLKEYEALIGGKIAEARSAFELLDAQMEKLLVAVEA